MNAVTLVETKLYDLSTIVVPEWDAAPDYRELENFRFILDNFDNDLSYRGSYRRLAGKVWNEAHVENDHRDALLMNEAYAVTAPVVQESREAQAHALAVMRAREERTLAEVETLRARVRELSRPIVDGSDPRLEEFWQKAMDEATEANFCSEYDRMASALGGPERTVTYDVDLIVTVRSSVCVTVTRGSSIDRSDIRNMVDLADIESNMSEISWSDVEVDDYNEVDM